MKRYEKQQDEIAKLEDFVQKYSSCIYDKTCAKSSETIRPYGIINKTIRDSKSASFHFDIENKVEMMFYK